MGAPEVPAWPDRLLATDHLPFVGRAWELGELRAAWEQAREGRRQVVLIGGEPGLGKSHLAVTAARHFHDEGAFVAAGSSFDELGSPFRPLTEVLTQLLDPRHGVADDLSPEVVGELARLVGAFGTDSTADPGLRSIRDDRAALFDAVTATIRTATRHWPLVVVLDDLHWASRPTLEMLDHVVRQTTTERLLVLATYRTTAPDHHDELVDAVAALIRHQGVEHLDLAGLDHDGVVAFLLASGVDQRLALRSADALLRETGGNAFLLRELWRHFEAHGGLEHLTRSATPLPRSIGDTIEVRLRSLPPERLRILELAAVVGHHGDVATLVEAGSAGPEATLAAVGDGVDVGVLRFVDAGSTAYAFVHDLARHVLIDRVAPADRAKLHADVASALERDGRAERSPSRLAHHWTHAGVFDHERRAAHWLVHAGRDAEHSLAFEEAARHLERAADLVGPSDDRHAHLLLDAASNAVQAGAFADGRRLFAQLADHPDPLVVARAAIGFEDSCWRPGLSDEQSTDMLERAAALLPPGHPDRVRVLASLGRSLSFLGRWDQAVTINDAAIESARSHGDDELLAVALQASLWSRAGNADGRIESWLERAREGGDLAERLGDMELLAQAATYRGSLAYGAGRPEEWRAARRQLELASRGSAQPFYAYMAGCSDQAEAYLRGDFDEAERLAEALLDLGGVFGQDDTEGLYGLQMFMVRRASGQLDSIRPLIHDVDRLGSRSWKPGLLAICTELGLLDDCRWLLAQLLRSDLDAERHSSQWPAMLAFLCDAVVWLNDDVAARRLLPYVEPFAGVNLSAGHFVAVFGSGDRYLAALLGVLGSAEADRHFELALDMDRRMDAPVHVAETLTRWAQSTTTPDPIGAADRRRDAHELATSLGMTALAAATAPPANGDATHSRAGDQRPDGLSAREIEVLRCIARGCSNREIATELFIAENTVANHVRHIMMKTGSSNRTQAAIYAARRDLV